METKTEIHCVELKNRIQANMLKEHHGLSDAEIEARQHEQLRKSSSPIAEWWRKVTQPISAEEN